MEKDRPILDEIIRYQFRYRCRYGIDPRVRFEPTGLTIVVCRGYLRAPLAYRGNSRLLYGATFIAVMFFGWDKVSKRFHLASTWLTIIGATLSALRGS